MLKETCDFVNKKIEPKLNRLLVIFNVKLLFKNVLTVETIDLIIELAFKDSNIMKK